MRIEWTSNGWKILAPRLAGTVCFRDVACRCGFRVGEICGALGCSEGYFRKVFVRDTGLSPKQWLKEERMLVARQQLEKGRELREVAEALGFSSAGSFCREFRMIFSASPGRWSRDQREVEK